MTKPRRKTAPPDSSQPRRSAPVPRYSTHRPKKKPANTPDVVISDREEDEPAEAESPSRAPTTRPPPPSRGATHPSEARLKRSDVSDTSIAELIAELMVDLSPFGPPKSTREPKKTSAPSSRGKKEKLPRAVREEVVPPRRRDPRRDDD